MLFLNLTDSCLQKTHGAQGHRNPDLHKGMKNKQPEPRQRGTEWCLVLTRTETP